MKILPKYVFLCLIVVLVPLHAIAAASPNAKRRISESEFLRLVKADQTISNRTVPAMAIIKALLWTQEAAKRHEQLPTNIALTDCVVEGVVTFYEDLTLDEDPRDKNGAGYQRLLSETPVDSLPAEESKFYKDKGFEKVFVIPVGLSISYTQFKTDYAHFNLLGTVFEGELIFNSVDFGEANLRFDNSIFKQQLVLQSCTVKHEARYKSALFREKVSVSGSNFGASLAFDDCDFQEDVYFTSIVGEELRIAENISFTRAFIRGELSFSFVTFGGQPDFTAANILGAVYIEYCKVGGDAFFTDLNKDSASPAGVLYFEDTTFSERAYFNNSKLDILSFFPSAEDEGPGELKSAATGVSPPVVFNKRSIFTGLVCNHANFHEVEFRDYADFSDAQFAKNAHFSGASFEGDVSFFNARFPQLDSPGQKLVLDRVHFSRGVILDWTQINHSLNTKETETLKRIESAFKQSGDLAGQNEVMYQRRFLEGSQSGRWTRLLNRLDLAFWGYGVRPMRLFGWMMVLLAIFTIIYWTQTAALSDSNSKLRNAWKRLKFALAFSLRTAWTWGYGYKNARTTTFKILTMVHSIGFKILLLCLVQAFANTSPLLNQLVGKLIHV
jgi:uncharacterized protein YjbI with pentapeptide repeats